MCYMEHRAHWAITEQMKKECSRSNPETLEEREGQIKI